MNRLHDHTFSRLVLAMLLLAVVGLIGSAVATVAPMIPPAFAGGGHGGGGGGGGGGTTPSDAETVITTFLPSPVVPQETHHGFVIVQREGQFVEGLMGPHVKFSETPGGAQDEQDCREALPGVYHFTHRGVEPGDLFYEFHAAERPMMEEIEATLPSLTVEWNACEIVSELPVSGLEGDYHVRFRTKPGHIDVPMGGTVQIEVLFQVLDHTDTPQSGVCGTTGLVAGDVYLRDPASRRVLVPAIPVSEHEPGIYAAHVTLDHAGLAAGVEVPYDIVLHVDLDGDRAVSEGEVCTFRIHATTQ